MQETVDDMQDIVDDVPQLADFNKSRFSNAAFLETSALKARSCNVTTNITRPSPTCSVELVGETLAIHPAILLIFQEEAFERHGRGCII